jgi:hypothetical protein
MHLGQCLLIGLRCFIHSCKWLPCAIRLLHTVTGAGLHGTVDVEHGKANEQGDRDPTDGRRCTHAHLPPVIHRNVAGA